MEQTSSVAHAQPLGNAGQEQALHVTSTNNSRIQVIDQIGGLSQRLVVLKVCAIVLCTSGQAELSIGGRDFQMTAGDLFVCRPNVPVEPQSSSADFTCSGMLVPIDFFDRNISMPGNMWETLRFLDNSPVIHLTDEERQIMQQYVALVRAKLHAEPLRHHADVVDSIVRAFIYELGDRTERFIEHNDTSYSSAENLFERFIRLLSSVYPKPREVKDYAQRLCVTPKYLSAVCKHVTGKPASAIINHAIVQDIKFHLRRKDKSIKEIASEMGIPNLSYFGKYVRRELGMSPRTFRQQAADENNKKII